VVLRVTTAQYGAVLTDARGFALYTYTADEPGGAGCTGHCLVVWPPLLLHAGTAVPTGGPGVTGLGTFTRPEGRQVTYHGLPLYTYIKDTQPGQMTGQKVADSGGVWYLATIGSPSASPGTAAASPATASPSTLRSSPSVPAPPATTPPAAVPTTRPPVTGPPATNPTVTAAPVTQPPATQPPVTSPPVTSPPTTHAPVTAPPTSPPSTAPPGGPSY
jgi:predicted lipoprotein with Yx(FWY)xxD motif